MKLLPKRYIFEEWLKVDEGARPHFKTLKEFERHALMPLSSTYDPRMGLPSQPVFSQIESQNWLQQTPCIPDWLYEEMCDEKRKSSKPFVFVHTKSQLAEMSTQELKLNTEWGPEELFEDKLGKQSTKFTPSQVDRNVQRSIEIQKKERAEREARELQRAKEELDKEDEKKRTNEYIESLPSQQSDLFGTSLPGSQNWDGKGNSFTQVEGYS